MRLQVSVHTAVVSKQHRGNVLSIQNRGKRFLMDFRKFLVMVEQVQLLGLHYTIEPLSVQLTYRTNIRYWHWHKICLAEKD